jgi:uncharacterized protein (DUF58 family)
MIPQPEAILKKIRRLELKTRRLVESSFAGQYHSVFKGRGMNFEEVREYAPGDEIRSIDWNVTARMDKPFVKKFTEERELSVLLVVDVSSSGEYGSISASKRELAAEVAAILAFSAINNNDKVGLVLFSSRIELFIPPRKGRQHTLRLIRDMLYFQPSEKGTDVAGALDYVNRVLARKAVVFLISDFLADDFSKPLTIASRKHDLVALPVRDPGEDQLPDVGWVTFEDAESGRQVSVNTSSRAARNAFAAFEEKRWASLKKVFSARGVDVVPLSTDQDYLVPLRNFFANRERRRGA